MKKLVFLSLALLLLGLSACGQVQPSPTSGVVTPPPVTEPAETDPVKTEPVDTQPIAGYGITVEGIHLIPGTPFDEKKMPKPNGKFKAPGSTGEGGDTLYYYDTAELTVADINGEPIIYTITLIDGETATPEGLLLGDEAAKVESIYGSNFEKEGAAMVYERGNTQLRILIDNGVVFNIEYRMINP